MPQFSSKKKGPREPKVTSSSAKVEYRGYVQVALPEDFEEDAAIQTGDQVLDQLLWIMQKGYRVSIEPTPEGDIRATAYGVRTTGGLDDGVGVSAGCPESYTAITALYVKLLAAGCALHTRLVEKKDDKPKYW